MDKARVTRFVGFIRMREAHRAAKEDGATLKKPDPIISKYRFCNVRRNDDRVTKWVMENIVAKYRDDPNLWFYLVVARLFNKPETLAKIMPSVVDFSPAKLRPKLKAMRKDDKIFNAAYIVSTNGKAMDKVDYLIDLVLRPLWAQRKMISAAVSIQTMLEETHILLMAFDGLGSFMAAQVLADLKYADPGHWRDFDTFAASGPGSRRGLNRVMGRDFDFPWREVDFRRELAGLREQVNKQLGWPEPLTAQDVQNCLCEFDKYERARLGTGEPKQLYRPHEEK